jgi:(p)ppGpp synthase/HD superfamily hydrolase
MTQKAFLFALKAHANQKRKDGSEYITHPVAVALELAKNGADDILISAGFLHDVIEDTDVTPEQLAENFPKEVVELVLADSEDTSKSWEERKTTDIENIRNTKDERLKLLMCADKLSNLKTLVEMLENNPSENVWANFKRPKEKQKWFYESMCDALSSLDGYKVYDELKKYIQIVFGEDEKRSEL